MSFVKALSRSWKAAWAAYCIARREPSWSPLGSRVVFRAYERLEAARRAAEHD
jgi:hypothetical protein